MTKLEEVARAIERVSSGSASQCSHMDYARAAIEVLREPYNPILKAGATALSQRRFGCPPEDEIDAARIFSRMIDAILQEKP